MNNLAHGELGRDDYLTPPDVCEFGRLCLGGPFDLDPCSQHNRNQIAQAEQIFTKEDNGLLQPWNCKRAIVNPPGGRTRLGLMFWTKLIEEYASGRCQSAIFIAFSIDYLQTTQNKHPVCPGGMLEFPTIVPSKRLKYWDVTELGVPFQTPKAMRPSVICILPPLDGPQPEYRRALLAMNVPGIWLDPEI